MKTHKISIYYFVFCFEMLIGKHLLNMHVYVCVKEKRREYAWHQEVIWFVEQVSGLNKNVMLICKHNSICDAGRVFIEVI